MWEHVIRDHGGLNTKKKKKRALNVTEICSGTSLILKQIRESLNMRHKRRRPLNREIIHFKIRFKTKELSKNLI